MNRTILMYVSCILYDFTIFVQEKQHPSGSNKLAFLSAHFCLCCTVASFVSRSVAVRLNMCSKLVRNTTFFFQNTSAVLLHFQPQSDPIWRSVTLQGRISDIQFLDNKSFVLVPAITSRNFDMELFRILIMDGESTSALYFPVRFPAE